MQRVQRPVITPKRNARNKGRLIGQAWPLLPKQVWAIRTQAELKWTCHALLPPQVLV